MRCLLIAVVATVVLVSCGGGSDDQPETASCAVARSELGPFSPDMPLGQSMNEDQARARMAQDGIVDWLAVSAVGPWDQMWDRATATLGEGIHVDLTWLDVNGEIRQLYGTDEVFEFTDLRVSRSFQGKIEHSDEPLFLPLQATANDVNFDAACVVAAVQVGDPTNDLLLEVLE